MVSQSRMVWFFSYLAGSRYGQPEYLEAARHGFRFLVDHLWDKESGGFFWEVDATGNEVTKPDKHLLGQAYGLFALSEFARVSNDSEAKYLAEQIFSLINQKAHDPELGGYIEFFRKDWTRIPDDRETYMRTPASIKTMNTHLHLLEAFIEYYRLSKESMARERLLELILIQSNSVVRKNITACTNLFHMDWSPCKGKLAERVTYGHDLENIWFLIEACRVAGIPFMPLADFFKASFQYTLKYGYDNLRGGLYDHGKLKRKANARHKVWWPQAETLVCALEMYRLFNEDIYLKCFDKTLYWILNYQIDWKKGEWHQRITLRGEKIGYKAEPWKTPYHNGRAIICCLNILEESLNEP